MPGCRQRKRQRKHRWMHRRRDWQTRMLVDIGKYYLPLIGRQEADSLMNRHQVPEMVIRRVLSEIRETTHPSRSDW